MSGESGGEREGEPREGQGEGTEGAGGGDGGETGTVVAWDVWRLIECQYSPLTGGEIVTTAYIA